MAKSIKAAKPAKATKAAKRKPAKPKAAKKTKARPSMMDPAILPAEASEVTVLNRLHAVVLSRRDADPSTSHSARLLSRGPAKVAQKFGEEAVECIIEAVAGNHDALIAESADVLYHLIVLWVSSSVTPEQVWRELARREGISGIAEKASRPKPVLAHLKPGTSKIP